MNPQRCGRLGEGVYFRLEQDMLDPVLIWLSSRVAEVKQEFGVPWGYCDVVGCTLSPDRVLRRLRMGQKAPIGPIERVSLLWQIPDVETGDAVSLEALASVFAPFLSSRRLSQELGVLIDRGFVVTTSTGEFQRQNGWFPLQKRLVAVELKLDRIRDVVCQAARHLAFADESYIALPIESAAALARSRRGEEMRAEGLGLIGVSPNGARTLIRARQSAILDPVVQAHCVERFWQTSVIGS